MPEEDENRKIRGRVISGYVKFIKKKWGSNGLSSCQAETGLDLSNIIDEKWYPNKDSYNIQKWLAEQHGLDMCKQLGFAVATNIGVISYLARLAGLKRVLDRATLEYRENLTHGQIRVDMGEKSAKIYFKDVNSGETQCITWIGVFEGIMHITKTKGSVKKIACELKGDENCVYELRWE